MSYILITDLMKLFKPNPHGVLHSPETSYADVSSTPLLTHSDETIVHHLPPVKPAQETDSSKFDLGVARISLIIDIIANACMGLAFSPVAFTAFGMLGAMSTGFNPALQSVALGLYNRRGGSAEAGKLLGALSVVQALW